MGVDRAEAEDEPLSINVPNMLHHIFDADFKHLLSKVKITQNVTCKQPDHAVDIADKARRMSYIFDDGEHKNLALSDGRKCEGGHCCDSCSRNTFPNFATEA